jgi:hypothetical protein
MLRPREGEFVMRSIPILLVPLVVTIPAACSTPGGGPLGFVIFDKNQHVAGAGPLFAIDEEQCINGTFLLTTFSGKVPASETPTCRRVREAIQNALPYGNLYDARDPYSTVRKDAAGNVLEPYLKRERNEVIGTFVWDSNKACGDYVRFLQTYQANVRSTSGILSQATAILATVVTGGATRGFAAASGIIGGAGNTLYEAHFANQTVALLVQAFDNARAEKLKHISDMMQCTPEQYPLTVAMADVYDYHTTCSVVAGLKQAQQAVADQRSPSLDSLAKMIDQIKQAQDQFAKISKPESGATGDTTMTGGDSTKKNGQSSGSNSGNVESGSASPGDSKPKPAQGDGSSPDKPDQGGADQGTTTSVPVCPFDAAKKQQQQQSKPTKTAKKVTKPKSNVKKTTPAKSNAKRAIRTKSAV